MNSPILAVSPRGSLGLPDDTSQSSKRAHAEPGFCNQAPRSHSPAEVALAAIQCFPTPILVLSSLKTVITASEAMRRLLGASPAVPTSDGPILHHEPTQTFAGDTLRNQTLAQIGIDIIQDGQPVWVNWESFLDEVASADHVGLALKPKLDSQQSSADRRANAGPQSAPTTRFFTSSAITVKRPSRVTRHIAGDTTVDVIFSQFNSFSAGSSSPRTSQEDRIQAQMIISPWIIDNQQYFTLTFINEFRHFSNSATLESDRTTCTSIPDAMHADSMARILPSNICEKCTQDTFSRLTNRGSAFPMPLNVPRPQDSSLLSPHKALSVLQKTLEMKDAIINGMEIPVIAMWHDESLAFPNEAARRMMQSHNDPLSDNPHDPLSRIQGWTEDFERELRDDEYPLIQLCRSQKPFKKWTIGIKDAKKGRLVFDVSGEGVFDPATGEFLAGIVALKDITEYANIIKTQTERNEQQFQLICDVCPQMLWTTTIDGLHDWFSKRWYDYTGMTVEKSLGTGWQNPFHADDTPEAIKRWAHSLATGDEYSTEYRCQRRDGAWRWMLGRALPLKDPKSGKIRKWIGTCTDIHDLVEARLAAKLIREQLLNVIKHAQVTVWSIDRQCCLTFLEGTWLWDDDNDITTDCLGKNVYRIFGKHQGLDDLPSYKEPIDDILNGKSRERVAEHRVDGKGRWFRTRFVPILGKKGYGGTVDETYIDGVVGITQDVSELREREADLRSREQENSRLLSAETAAKEASRLKSQFLANMSHEIRTPIAGVIGMAELLLDTGLDEEQRECGENIRRSANGLLTVINDILDLSKVESGRLDIEEVQFSLSVVIQDVCKMLSFAAERKDLTFESDIRVGVDEDLIVLGDPGRCRQILTNLLTNSIKFTSEGFVKLSVTAEQETHEMVEILFAVEDTGIGIEEEVRQRLFKPFSQADSSTARRFGGTGLGLTICKNLVDLMHGQISLVSELGTGTKATFSIPFHKPHGRNGGDPLVGLQSLPERLRSEMSVSVYGSDERTSSSPPLQHPAEFSNAIEHHGVKGPDSGRLSVLAHGYDHESSLPADERTEIHVLVVEDNHVNQQIALKTIKKLGFSVAAVWNGQEALDYLLQAPTTQHRHPDIILMDVQMPILDGYRATHLIRHHIPYSKLPEIRNIPIVAMTASAIQGDREKCERAGMDDYLAKPVRGKTLEKMLVKWALRSRTGPFKPRPSLADGDHDSNCADGDKSSPRKYPVFGLKSMQSPGNSPRSHAMADRNRLPGPESEGDRGMRRVEAEEKARALRDDKLMNTAHPLPLHPGHMIRSSSSGKPARPDAPVVALTAENIDKLGREQEEAASSASRLRRRLFSPEGSSSSLEVAARDRSPASTLGSLRSLNDGNVHAHQRRRFKMDRNDSDRSLMTVVPRDAGWER